MRNLLGTLGALGTAPKGFTVAELAAKVHSMTGQSDSGYSVRQAAYDLRKLRAQHLVVRPGRSRRYQVPPEALRTIVAITAFRRRVLSPLLGGIRSKRPVPRSRTWTDVDHDYENLRLDMQSLFERLGIATAPTPHIAITA